MKNLKTFKKMDLIEGYNGPVLLLNQENQTNIKLRNIACLLAGEYRQQAIDLIKRFGHDLKNYLTYNQNTKHTKNQIIDSIEKEHPEIEEEIDRMRDYNRILTDIIRSAELIKR